MQDRRVLPAPGDRLEEDRDILLRRFLAGFEFPVVAHLRQTQVYVWCARDGASVFDLPRSRAEQDWEQWKPLTRWIATHAAVRA